MAAGGFIPQQKGAGDLMDFHIGQKVIIDCHDADYMETIGIENGTVGEVLDIYPSYHIPVIVKVDSRIGSVECRFYFNELKPAQNTAKII